MSIPTPWVRTEACESEHASCDASEQPEAEQEMEEFMSTSERSLRTLVPIVVLMALALIMIAAPVYVFLGEKKIDVSPSLWNVALDLCRVVTGLSGILAIVSVVTDGRSGSSGDGTIGSLACGAALIAAGVAGLGLVIVITGLGGLALLCVGGVGALEAFRTSHPEPRRTLALRRGR